MAVEYKGKIIIDYVVTDDGTLCILPTEEEIKRTVAQIKEDPLTPDQATRDKRAKSYEEKTRSAIEKWRPRIQTREFKFRPYSHKDKIDARREAKIAQDPEDQRYDQDKFEAALMAAATGETLEAIQDLSEGIYARLNARVFAKQAITAEQLDFFDLSPSG